MVAGGASMVAGIVDFVIPWAIGQSWHEYHRKRLPIEPAYSAVENILLWLVVTVLVVGSHAGAWKVYRVLANEDRAGQHPTFSPTAWRVLIGGSYLVGLVLGGIFYFMP